MLTLLRIRNYAIIDDIEIEFFAGFSVLTGETGAGKSILVDALGLTLGDRADAGAVRAGAERAEVSIVFELESSHPGQAWLTERELDDDGICCLRRSISAEGRSRAFVNNQPVTLKDLKAIGELLVDIHGQHEHQSLIHARTQRQILDASGGHEELAQQVADAFGEWQRLNSELNDRRDRGASRAAELELLRFQLSELEALDIADGEPEALRLESHRLRNMDVLQQSIATSSTCLYDAETGSAYELVARARRALEGAAVHDPGLLAMLERVRALEIELRETGSELLHRLDQLEADPARLDAIESRLSRMQQMARRHRVDENELPGLPAVLAESIAALDTSAEAIAALESRTEELGRRYRALTQSLSAARREAGQALSTRVTTRLRELGLPNAEFDISIRPKAEAQCDSTGADAIEFLVSMNPGQAPGPVDRVASGGELSRIGLALAVAATDASTIPTLIFDEIDSGIGGATAEVVGRRLREIASRHQVICVTHLPQVASQGMQHYRIAKLTDGRVSHTQVRLLNPEQRIEELSRMLGGVEITATTRAHAAEMIRQAAAS